MANACHVTGATPTVPEKQVTHRSAAGPTGPEEEQRRDDMDEVTGVKRTPGRAALAAWAGSALEYYDLAIYGTAAALVFPQIFFPEGNDTAATVAAFATFGVAY